MGYSRLEPGRELEVREYISFQRGRDGFYELTECSVDELLKRKAESIVREKELCQRIDAAVEAWSKQAQQTQQYMKALEYVKMPPTPHTSNRWTVSEYGNHEMSNMVYRFSWREYERTEWDRTLKKSVPKSWELTWSVTFNTPHNPDYSGDGWKMLWKYCANGSYTGDSYGFDPLNRGDVQVSTFYSSSLYGKIDSAADSSSAPRTGTTTPESWGVVDIDDGTYYIAEYIGILDRADRTPEQTEAVKAFAEWFGSAETQTEWSDEFDSFPCNEVAVKNVYGDEIPAIYQLKNCALEKVEGTDMTYAEYVAAHSKEWTNIMTNLGFYWADASQAPAEPDWDNVNWAVMTQAAQ